MRPCFSLGHQDVTCERDERGICVHCASVVCAGCDRSFPADGGDVHEVTYVPGEDSPGYVCTSCLIGPDHSQDSDCTGHVNVDGDCSVCGVSGGEPCPACGGVRFHRSDCSPCNAECPVDPATGVCRHGNVIVEDDSDGVPLPSDEDDITAPTRPERAPSIKELGAAWAGKLSAGAPW